MKVLAIDTSALVASVAVAEDDQLIGEYTTNYKKTHSQTIMPMIEELKKRLDLDLNTLDLIAISSGPGSFTGLRIGAATAKGLAHALDLPIAAIPTLEALAHNIVFTDHLICPMMDARRNQVYTAIYAYQGQELKTIYEMSAVPIHEILTRLKEKNKPVIFLGDGVKPHIEHIMDVLPKGMYQIAPIHSNLQRAATIATLGMKYASEGKLQDYMAYGPIYLRKSQAEREYELRQKNANN